MSVEERTDVLRRPLIAERVKALVAVSGYLIGSREANKRPLPPPAELQWWYQFYFATERGRAGYEANRHAFNKLIWQIASPKWAFDDATFDRTAASFDNPDHVAIADSEGNVFESFDGGDAWQQTLRVPTRRLVIVE